MAISLCNVGKVFSSWEEHSRMSTSMQVRFAGMCKKKFASQDVAYKALSSLSIDFKNEASRKKLSQKNVVSIALSKELQKLQKKEIPRRRFRAIQKMQLPLADAKRKVAFLSTELKDDIKGSFERAILSAKRIVVLIMYAISNKSLISALKETADRGVNVIAVYDSTETSCDPSFLGKHVHGYPRGGKTPMHNKLLAVDRVSSWIGSANMSTQAMTQQGNFVIHITCEAVARRIEALADSLIAKDQLPHPPLQLAFPDATLMMFSNPSHGRASYDLLLAKIQRATSRIFVAMYTFTHRKFAEALAQANNRGVDVRVIVDQENMKKTNQPVFSLLSQQRVSCGYRTKRGLLHHKVFFIDNTLVAGSCNGTRAAFFANDETLFVIDPVPRALQKRVITWWNSVERQSSLV